MTTRTRVSLAISTTVILILAAIAATVFFRGHAAPEEVRLLPDAPAVVYANLKTVRHLTAFKAAAPVQREAEYEQFVRETGFEFERDLNQVAVAIHTGKARDTRFTEILSGQYDPQKCSAYLRRISRAVEHYGDRDIYQIEVENRTVRVVLLGVDLVAISNADDPAVIRGIIDRHKQIAQPFSGPTVVGQHYRDVPLGSVVWAIAQMPSTDGQPSSPQSLPLPGGLELSIPGASTVVGSIRVLGAVNARAEFVTQSEADAQRFAQQTEVFLNLFRAVQQSAQLSGSDPDVKAVFDSLKIEQQKERAIISASIPLGFLKKLFSEAPPLGTSESAPAVQSTKPGTKH